MVWISLQGRSHQPDRLREDGGQSAGLCGPHRRPVKGGAVFLRSMNHLMTMSRRRRKFGDMQTIEIESRKWLTIIPLSSLIEVRLIFSFQFFRFSKYLKKRSTSFSETSTPSSPAPTIRSSLRLKASSLTT